MEISQEYVHTHAVELGHMGAINIFKNKKKTFSHDRFKKISDSENTKLFSLCQEKLEAIADANPIFSRDTTRVSSTRVALGLSLK